MPRGKAGGQDHVLIRVFLIAVGAKHKAAAGAAVLRVPIDVRRQHKIGGGHIHMIVAIFKFVIAV